MPFCKSFLEHWKIAKQRFNIVEDDTGLIENLRVLVEEFENLDKRGISFRYSHDLERNNNFSRMNKVDIHRLHKYYLRAKLLLDHSIDVFEDKTGLMHEKVTKAELISQAK